jgi:hypothetical protein
MARGSSDKNFHKQKIRACAARSGQPNIFRYHSRHKPFNGGFVPEEFLLQYNQEKRTIHKQRLSRQREVPENKESVAA